MLAGLLLAGAAGAVWGYRRKRRMTVPAAAAATESKPKEETAEHAALREILERSAAYNDALFARLEQLSRIQEKGALPAAVEVLAHANEEERQGINVLRQALQATLDSRQMRFPDIDGFHELISQYRAIALEQEERHLELYHQARKMPGMPDSAELHAYLKLGFTDPEMKQEDTAQQIRRATEEQRQIMLRVGRLLAGVKDAESAEPAPDELLKISSRYQWLSNHMYRYRADDPDGAAEAVKELKAMYAGLTPPLKAQAAQLRKDGCYGNKPLYEILQRLLPEK